MDKALSFIRSRLGRNIIFWTLTALFVYTMNSNADEYSQGVYLLYKFATTSLLFLLTMCNNFLLIPKTLAKKKYVLFVLGMITELLVFSVAYLLLLKQMLYDYAGIHVYEVSLITSPVSDSLTFAVIIEEIGLFAFGLFLWVLTFTMAWYMNDHARKVKEIKEVKEKQMETELHLLRNQLSPHFLFNTLNNIYGLTLKKSDIAPEAVLKLSSLMRYMLYETEGKYTDFEKEKEVMQAFIDMECLRLNSTDGLDFTIDADRNYELSPLLWLPVLENAFKYATRVIDDNYHINFIFRVSGSVLTIESENSYKETNGNSIETGGVGLKNLYKRLSILYPDKHTVVVNKKNNVYSFKLQVEL